MAEEVPDIKTRLNSLSSKLGLMTGSQWVQRRGEEEQQRRAGVFEIEKTLPGQVIGGDDSRFYLVRRDFPLSHVQGSVELGAVLATNSYHIAFSACDPELEDFDPRATLFMDTETTGLCGGTGTVAFLVGVGYFVGDSFRLDQCFMRDFDEEEPLLQYLAELFATRNAVVGYNSKSFDLPLLRTRFIQNRIPYRLDGCMHYDVMHAARRIWKERLGSCTLGNVEQEILGLRREGDVPGHLIPQMWFDYLRTRDARPLKGVFYHHQMDILSLVALTGLVSHLLEQPGGSGFEHAEDRLSLVRMHFRQKHYAGVIEHATQFLETEDVSPLRKECLDMLAMACKRTQRFDEMAQYFERLVDEFPSHMEARLELAKHCEHRLRDLERAEALCTQAFELLERRAALMRDDRLYEAQMNTIQGRIERIRRKRARPLKGRAISEDDDVLPNDRDALDELP